MSESTETIDEENSDSKTPWVMTEPKEVDEPKKDGFGLFIILALFVALWVFTSVQTFVVVIGIFVAMTLHELGHFMTARWTGMKATQFFIFMGPRIWSFKRGETEYGIRSIPLGAFVRIVGMNNLDPCAPEDETRAYKNKSYPRRMLVITAGSIMHFIQALIILTLLLSVVGIERNSGEDWVVLDTGGVSKEAGLIKGDKILSVDDVDATSFQVMRDYVVERPGEKVEITYERDGNIKTAFPILSKNSDTGDGMLCLTQENTSSKYRERSGPTAGFKAFGTFVVQTFAGLNRIPGGYAKAVSNIGTPKEISVDPLANGCTGLNEEAYRPSSILGFVQIAGQAGSWEEVLIMLTAFNIFLGIFNLLPLLPLDGGHAAIATYERLRSRKNKVHQADVNKLVPLTYVVVFLMIGLTIPLLVLDIVRPIVLG